MRFYVRITHWQGVAVAVLIFLGLIIAPYAWSIRDSIEAQQLRRTETLRQIHRELKEIRDRL